MRHAPLVVLSMFAVACSSSEGAIDVSLVAGVAPSPTVNVVEGIDVTVTAVDVAIAPAPPAAPPDTPPTAPPTAPPVDPDDAWITVFDGSQPLDLIIASEVKAFLGTAPVPAGTVLQVRLVLAPDPTITVGGIDAPLRCPSCTPSGLKIVPHGTLTVPDGGVLDLELTFDVRASLQRDPVGYWLQPVVRL